jgi:hypothetical protein
MDRKTDEEMGRKTEMIGKIERETKRWRVRQIDRETEQLNGRKTYRQNDRKTE